MLGCYGAVAVRGVAATSSWKWPLDKIVCVRTILPERMRSSKSSLTIATGGRRGTYDEE